jgi:hypothetical protein
MPALEILLNGELLAVLQDADISSAGDVDVSDEVPRLHGESEQPPTARVLTQVSNGIGVTFQVDGRWQIRRGSAWSSPADEGHLRDADVLIIRVVE